MKYTRGDQFGPARFWADFFGPRAEPGPPIFFLLWAGFGQAKNDFLVFFWPAKAR